MQSVNVCVYSGTNRRVRVPSALMRNVSESYDVISYSSLCVYNECFHLCVALPALAISGLQYV